MKGRQLSFIVLVGWLCFGVTWNADGRDANAKLKKQSGEDTYMTNCEACHKMGKNVIKPGKDIVVSEKLVNLDEFKAFLSESHGVMPAFKEIADSPEIVSALYKFTKKLKNQNWEYVDKIDKTPVQPPSEKRGDKDIKRLPQ